MEGSPATRLSDLQTGEISANLGSAWDDIWSNMNVKPKDQIHMKALLPASTLAIVATLVVAYNPANEQPPAGAVEKITASIPASCWCFHGRMASATNRL